MVNNRYVVLSAAEWTRLKNQGVIETPKQEEHPYTVIKRTMDEKSRKKMEKWPGALPEQVKAMRLQRVNTKKEKRIEAYKKAEAENIIREAKEAHDTAEKAKLQLFRSGCYGQQLLSAVLESQALEERELQREQNKKSRSQAAIRKAELEAKERCIINLDRDDEEILEQRKKNIEFAEINRKTHQNQFEEKSKVNEEVLQFAKHEAMMTQKLLEFEAADMVKYKPLIKQAQEQFAEDCRQIKEIRAKEDELDNALIQVWRKQLDDRRCKVKEVYHKEHMEKQDTENYKIAFNVLKNCIETKEKKFLDFLQKGVERAEKIENKSLEKESKKIEEDKKKRIDISLHNKTEGEKWKYQKEMTKDPNLCECWKQSLFTKSCGDAKHERSLKKAAYTAPAPPQYHSLCCQLKQRQLEPSPWTGNHEADEYFEKQAAATVEECKYKHLPLKVIEEYRKLNVLKKKYQPHIDDHCKCKSS